MYTLPKIRDDLHHLQPSQLSAWVIFTIHRPLTVLTLHPNHILLCLRVVGVCGVYIRTI